LRNGNYTSPENFLFVQVGTLAVLGFLVGFSVWRIFHNLTFDASKTWDFNYFFVNKETLFYAAVSILIILTFFFLFEKALKKSFYILFLTPFIILISGKGQALIAVSIFALANLGLGITIYSVLRPPRRICVQGIIFPLFLGGSINSILIWVGMHFKVNFQLAYYLFFLLQIFIFRNELLTCFREIRGKIRDELSWGQKIIFITGAFFVFYALVPSYLCDDLIRHLYIPKYVLLNGFWDFNPRFIYSLDLAIIPYGSFTSVFLMGGEYAVRMINYSVLFAGFLLMESFVRQRYGSRVALFTTLLCVFTPFLLWELGVIFIDSFVFLASILVCVCLFQSVQNLENRKGIILFFVLSAFAFLCKMQFLFIGIPAGIVLLFCVLKRRIEIKDNSAFYYCFIGLILFLGIIIPFLLHNYIISKNPFFFYFNGIFKSEWFYPTNFRDDLWRHPLNWRTIYDITFSGSKYIENINYSFGISYFVLLIFFPLLFTRREKRGEALIMLFIFVCAIILWFETTNPYLRYFITILPVGSLILALIMNRILEWNRGKVKNIIIWFLFLTIFMTNFICQLATGNVTSPYPLRDAILHTYEKAGYWQDVKKVFDFATIKYGKESRGLLIDSWGLYFADFNIEGSWHVFYKNMKEIIEASTNPQEMYTNIFVKRKFDFIIMPDRPENGILNSPEFKEMLNKEFSEVGLSLYSPKKERELRN